MGPILSKKQMTEEDIKLHWKYSSPLCAPESLYNMGL